MTRISEIGERGLIEDFRTFLRTGADVGPGDDAAVIGGDLVVTSDMVSFDRHMPAGMTFEQFGWYSAAVSFSDLAAMGARPIGFLASLGLPGDLDAQMAYDIMSGIDQCAEFCDTFVVGGDTKPGPGIVAGTALGRMEGRKPMLRSGAKAGDLLAVTGPLGAPAAALLAMDHGLEAPDAMSCLCLPVPKVEEGIALASSGRVTACMDLSDSLGTALNTLCEASHVSIEVYPDFVPLGPDVERVAELTGTPTDDLVFGCGGEYELLFTVGRDGLDALYSTDVEFTVIGKVAEGGRPYKVRPGKTEEVGYGTY